MKALLVDLDDTLLDYSGGVEDSWRRAAAVAVERGVDGAALAEAIFRARRWFWDDPGRHRRERLDMIGAWRQIAARGLADVGAADANLAAAIAHAYADHRWERMALYPGVRDALGRLRSQGLRMALVTNGDARQQRRKVEQYDLADFFDAILIEGEFGAGKPDESVYRHALAAIGARPDESWMVGDNLEWDVAGPQRLGLRGIWVDQRGTGLPEPSPVVPHRIIRTFPELTA